MMKYIGEVKLLCWTCRKKSGTSSGGERSLEGYPMGYLVGGSNHDWMCVYRDLACGLCRRYGDVG